MQTIPLWITTDLPGTGRSCLSPSRFILFLLLLEGKDCQGRILYLYSISSNQCGCRNSTFTIPFSSGWDPGRCVFTSTFSMVTEELFPCHHIFQGPPAACRDLEKEETENLKISWKADLWAAKTVGHIVLLIQFLCPWTSSFLNHHSSLVICGIPTWQERTWAVVSPN